MSDGRPAKNLHPGANFQRWLGDHLLLAELRAANGENVTGTHPEPGELGLIVLALILPLVPKSARGELDLRRVDDLVGRLGDEREVYRLFQTAEELLQAFLAASPNPHRESRS